MTQFVCTECTYPCAPGGIACDNPACLANPSHSEAHRARLVAQREAYQAQVKADQARRDQRARLRAAGFTTAF